MALAVGGGVLLVVLSFIAVSLALQALEIDSSLGTFALAQVVAYAGQAWIAWYVLFRRRGAAPHQVGFKWVGPGPILLMIPALVGLIFVNIPVGILSSMLFDEVTTPREQLLGEGDSFPLASFIPLFFVVVVVAPIVEEFIFRGMFFRLLRSHRSFWAAAFISALVFSITHFIPSLVLFLFVLGLVLAWVVERYESLYPAMALHAFNNAFAVIVLYVALN
ncbi:MAG: CPBP family intramembrane metalloprotease [Actinomycetota bacterium]|nr:CPBP family intramembrane metalloprotease [Actinomycetota bacterium]